LGKGRALLDIGSGTGEFLNHCKEAGFSVEGIEPSESARKLTKNNFNIIAKEESDLGSIPDESQDFVSMWHVLEHVYHLNDRIKQIYRLLKKDGKVIIAVPNLNSYDAKHYKEYWAAYDLPRHLYHFRPTDVEAIFKKHDFSLEKILPMKFDSYYVSMLSEKYRNGRVNYFNAFYIGLKSNLKAGKKAEYSSQIYILSKN
jgi:2-polyprenyl-3-methyl-5-hydroxy-6-metoxy-1,4-benzoquinol methylase